MFRKPSLKISCVFCAGFLVAAVAVSLTAQSAAAAHKHAAPVVHRETERLGHLLAPAAVRYVVVVTRPGSGHGAVVPADPALSDALTRQLFSRWLVRHQEYVEHRERWPKEVRDATGSSNFILFGTTEEFDELQQAWGRLIMKYHDRIADPSRRPEGWQMFELQLFTHPLDPGPLAVLRGNGSGWRRGEATRRSMAVDEETMHEADDGPDQCDANFAR